MRQVDHLIIGAGPGGYKLAAGLAARGESVVVAEKAELGGTCLNRGCIPTKCLCATAETAIAARRASDFGVECGDVSIDFLKATDRMRSVMGTLRQGVEAVLAGAEVVRGEAVITGDRRVRVGEDEFDASHIYICTGSRPAVLPIPGAELAMTSDELLADAQLPKSMVIIGGGVIGIEFASIFAAMGVEVTVVEYCKEILPPFDPEVAKRLRMSLTRRGIKIVCGAAVQRIDRMPGERFAVVYAGKRGEESVETDRVVMAVGRRAVLPEGLEHLGIEPDKRGFIPVNDMMQTANEAVYAIGDVNGLSMLAHSAYAQAHVVEHKDPACFQCDIIPSVVFAHPEVASVGRWDAEDTYTIKHVYASNGKAQAMGEPDGFVKITCRQSDNAVVAVSAIGAHAADIIAEAGILVANHTPYPEATLRYIQAHPTLSELLI